MEDTSVTETETTDQDFEIDYKAAARDALNRDQQELANGEIAPRSQNGSTVSRTFSPLEDRTLSLTLLYSAIIPCDCEYQSFEVLGHLDCQNC